MNAVAADQTQRDRVRAGHADTLFVEAGAGTGKTTALVARVVDMVATGHLASIDGPAAITFTENAAAEMRSRIREGLEDGSCGAHRSTTYNETQRDRCRTALDHLDDAVISTLHGWASRILSEAPFEAGLPPSFAVAASAGEQDLREEAWQDAVADLLADDTVRDHVLTGLTLGLTVSLLREVATGLAQSWDLLRSRPLRRQPLPDVDTRDIVRHLREAVKDVGRWPDDDGLTTFLQQVALPTLHQLQTAAERWDILELLATGLGCRGGKTPAWIAAGLDKQAVVTALQEAETARAVLLESVGAAVTETLAARLQDWLLEQAGQRRDAGSLDYHDLLVLARDVLREHRSVRDRLHDAWPVLLIDEFQDTDPLQIEIACLIAGDCGDNPPEHWSDMEIQPGRLFFVGDAKQSIYRFRRADVSVFAAVGQRHHPGRTGLTVNFRSVPGVLAAANHAFSELIGADPQAGIPYAALQAARPQPSGAAPPVLLLGGPQPPANAATLRQAEAEHIADVIVRAKSEAWPVRGGDPATYSDVTILMPARTILPALERALEARAVPYRIESRSLVWSTEAVAKLITLLQAIDSPADEVALLAALRQPGLACSDVDLLQWRAAGGRWSILAQTPAELSDQHPVAQALHLLRSWHQRRWWVPVNQLVEEVVRELRLVELTASQSRPRDHWRRLRFVVDQARAWCDAGGSGLSGFVAWAVRQIDSDIDVLETVFPEIDDDAVRILTVHGSKGLEFPITVVAGINSAGRRGGSVLWSDTGPVVRLKAETLEMRAWADASTTEKAQAGREATRLLYVALTRAMDHLVIGCYHRPAKSGTPTAAQRLWELLASGPLVRTERQASSTERTTGLEPAGTNRFPDRDEFARERALLLEKVAARIATSPTALTSDSGTVAQVDAVHVEAGSVEVSETLGVPVAHRRHRAGRGTAIGTAVHRVLELADLASASDAELTRLATAACAEQDIEDLVDDVVARARTALGADVARQAGAGRSWREVYLVVDDDTRFVEGYIDLLAQTQAGELVVVDWKTDRATTPQELAVKREHYAPQLAAYADAVERVLAQRPVTHLVFPSAQSFDC